MAMADWLTGLGVTRVVMEATGDYWRPPFYLLENSFEAWLVIVSVRSEHPARPASRGLQPSVELRPLESHPGSTDEWGMLCPDSRPVCIGAADPGVTWTCFNCGTPLIVAVHNDQVLDLVRCFDCGSVCASTRRAPGRPVAGRPVLIPPGKFRLGSSLDWSQTSVMMVGQQAWDGYVAETGARPAELGPESHGPRDLSPESLRELGLAEYLGGCRLGVSRAHMVWYPVAMEGMAVQDRCGFKGFHVRVEARTTTPPQTTGHT